MLLFFCNFAILNPWNELEFASCNPWTVLHKKPQTPARARIIENIWGSNFLILALFKTKVACDTSNYRKIGTRISFLWSKQTVLIGAVVARRYSMGHLATNDIALLLVEVLVTWNRRINDQLYFQWFRDFWFDLLIDWRMDLKIERKR